MIRQELYLPNYDWVCVFYYDVRRDNAPTILAMLRMAGCKDGNYERARRNLCEGHENTGLTFTDPRERITISVIGHTSSKREFWNTLDHEKGHVVEHIADALDIERGTEDYEYLRGALAEYTFPVAQRFLCGKCSPKSTKKGLILRI